MMVHQIYFAFIATYCFGIMFNIRGTKLLFTSIAGSICWGTFLLSQDLGKGQVEAYFLAAVILSICSELGARYLKTPVTSILICALIPIVPGGGMYYTMYNIVKNKPLEGFTVGISTFSAAGALAMGIVFVTSMVRVINKKMTETKRRREQ